MSEQTQILICGGGPTGLLLGIYLAKEKIPFLLLEKKESRAQHSKSIGIHPPSLLLLKDAEVLDDVLRSGNKITAGRAFVGSKDTGTISFDDLEHDYPFIITLSQSITENLLEQKLLELAPNAFRKGCEITEVKQKKESVLATLSSGEQINCEYLVGCDGKHSEIRKQAGIDFLGGSYPDTYIMGDFEDTVGKRNEAQVFLCPDGLIESFPHGQNLRRWVLKTDHFIQEPNAVSLAQKAKERTGTAPDAETCSMISSFKVERKMAESFYKGRIILAGDAAHLVSPIGGQGMNLGWLDAAFLAKLFPEILNPKKPRPSLLNSYEYNRRRAAFTAAQRAEFNMKTGRAFSASPLSLWMKKLQVKIMLKPPARGILLKKFTMDGLD
ncbi:MAG: FAD-dependent monooxygenase [Balneolales bacterium]|nr:FAD-dependent monooxygenase [Balneolales bacterium]